MKGANYTQSMGISADFDYIYDLFPGIENKPSKLPDYSSKYRDRIGNRDIYLAGMIKNSMRNLFLKELIPDFFALNRKRIDFTFPFLRCFAFYYPQCLEFFQYSCCVCFGYFGFR